MHKFIPEIYPLWESRGLDEWHLFDGKNYLDWAIEAIDLAKIVGIDVIQARIEPECGFPVKYALDNGLKLEIIARNPEAFGHLAGIYPGKVDIYHLYHLKSPLDTGHFAIIGPSLYVENRHKPKSENPGGVALNNNSLENGTIFKQLRNFDRSFKEMREYSHKEPFDSFPRNQ